mmetsp:Transcript_18677/g.63297  ORF Transcript_18677/g.63297 Transcript_18677/m.63297 type:complete len:246 (+) Transcript_18677:2-739(+)
MGPEDSTKAPASPEFPVGTWVMIDGLQSELGRTFNGSCGEVTDPPMGLRVPEGRVAVWVDGADCDPVALSVGKLTRVAQEDMCCYVRLSCRGEKDCFAEHLYLPRVHSMFTSAPPLGTCEVFEDLVPLCCVKTEPKVPLRDRASYDNQWATWFMIKRSDGFAPPEWQSFVGPVYLFRPGGLDLSIDDLSAMNMFVSQLLDMYSDVSFEYAQSQITMEKLRYAVENHVSTQRQLGAPDVARNINIM